MYAGKRRLVIQMSENKRFELQVDVQGKADIIDWVESKEKNAICIYNDLGVLPFSSAKAVCDKLNEQDEQIKELEKENENQSNILEDFMLMLNRLQANPNNKMLQSMAKDMLRMMGKGIMGDYE